VNEAKLNGKARSSRVRGESEGSLTLISPHGIAQQMHRERIVVGSYYHSGSHTVEALQRSHHGHSLQDLEAPRRQNQHQTALSPLNEE